MTQRYTRAELYELVWSQPLRTLAKSVGVSDVAIAKRCREANIPLPGLGYWAKKDAGKPVLQPKLPARALGQADNVAFGRYAYYSQGPSDDELVEMMLPEPPKFEDGIEEVKARAKALAAKVRGSTLERLHPAVAKILEQDEIKRKKYAEHKYSWDKPVFDEPNEKRRLRLLNSLLNAFASVGCRGSTRPKDGYEFSVRIGDLTVSLTLAPKNFDRQRHYPGNLVANDGKLTLHVEWPRPDNAEITASWSDADGLLDKRLPELIAGALVVAECGYRDHLVRGHGYLVERKARAIEEHKRRIEEAARKERERIEREAKARFDALLAEVRSWKTAQEIRAYVQARTERVQDNSEMHVWATWALGEAKRIDPLEQS